MNVFDVRNVCGNVLGTSYKIPMLKRSWICSLSASAALTLALTVNADDLDADMAKVPPPANKKGVTFEKDIKPVVEKSCMKCHSGPKPKGKYRMDTLAEVIKGGVSGEPAVVPGESAKSPIVLFASDAVLDMEMPPIDNRDKYPPLTKDQIGLIRAWIDQGAK